MSGVARRSTEAGTHRPEAARVGQNTMLLQTPNLSVGICTAGGLRIWGTHTTEIAFGQPRARRQTLAAHPTAAQEEARQVHSRFFAIYDRSGQSPPRVPQVRYIKELPRGPAVDGLRLAEGKQRAPSAFVRIDLYDPVSGTEAHGAHPSGRARPEAVAEAYIFVVPPSTKAARAARPATE